MVTQDSKVSEILRAALALLKSTPQAWTKKAFARDAAGNSLWDGYDSDAVCFCLAGAIEHVVDTNVPTRVDAALNDALPLSCPSYITYNDSPRCEFRHIRALVGKAIIQAEARGE